MENVANPGAAGRKKSYWPNYAGQGPTRRKPAIVTDRPACRRGL